MASSILFAAMPDLDLGMASWFHHDGHFYLARSWWATFLHHSVGYFIGLAIVTVLAIYLFNRVTGRNVCKVRGMTVIYLFLVLAFGAGLIVNSALKDGFGRARPRNVVEFGGSQRFSPAFYISTSCVSNCSFSSGDSSGAFFAFALALALSRRRAPLVVAAGYGTLVSFSRIASGAHFFSDTVVSFFVMWITADVLYYYLLLPSLAGAPTGSLAPHGPVLPALPALRKSRGAVALSETPP